MKKSKLIYFLLLLLFFSFSKQTFSGIEEEFKRQKIYKCSFSNSQFHSIEHKRMRYCINQNTWREYFSNGLVGDEGLLNRYMKTINYDFYSTDSLIFKYTVEGNRLYYYACNGNTDMDNFDCVGPVSRRMVGFRSAGYYGAETKWSEKDFLGAIERYTFGLRVEPTNYMLLLGRSANKFELNNYSGALEDITEAINMHTRKGDHGLHEILCSNFEKFISSSKENRSKWNSKLIKSC